MLVCWYTGCSALHCAIDMHDRVIHKSKIDSRRTIYQLINKGANIAVKVSHSLARVHAVLVQYSNATYNVD